MVEATVSNKTSKNETVSSDEHKFT